MQSNKFIEPSLLIKKLIQNPQFHQQHKMEVIDWSRGVISDNMKQGFHQTLDQAKLADFIKNQRQKIITCFQHPQTLRIQMVGSTSIPGMCGMFAPDFGIFVKQFPPSDSTFRALSKVGYELAGFYNLDETFDDLWLFKRFQKRTEDGQIVGATIHIWKQGSKMADKLISFRDLAKVDKKVFDDYRNKKLEMMNKEVVNKKQFMDYKISKGKVAANALKQAENINK